MSDLEIKYMMKKRESGPLNFVNNEKKLSDNSKKNSLN